VRNPEFQHGGSFDFDYHTHLVLSGGATSPVWTIVFAAGKPDNSLKNLL
jgi:hypothetical protein